MKMRTLLFILLLYSPVIQAQTFLSEILSERDSLFSVWEGEVYPDFEIMSLGGDTISNQIFEDKVTLLTFWFAECAPCIVELEALKKLWEKYKDEPRFQIISIMRDNKVDAKRAVEKYKLPYTVCPVEQIGILNFEQGFPTNFIIDEEGKIAFLKFGGSLNAGGVEELLDKEIQKILSL